MGGKCTVRGLTGGNGKSKLARNEAAVKDGRNKEKGPRENESEVGRGGRTGRKVEGTFDAGMRVREEYAGGEDARAGGSEEDCTQRREGDPHEGDELR